MSLLQMSFAGAIMILAIIIIRALVINLLPKKTFLALWGIVIVRLLFPFSLPSAFSVYSLIGKHTQKKDPQIIGMLPIEVKRQVSTIPNNILNISNSISIWMIIWIVGALICTLFFAIVYWKCRQEFQMSLPVDNDFIKNWLGTHRLKRSIAIRQSSRFSAPLTYGVFHPVILMPTSTEWENTNSMRYVLTHEYVHIRRFDSLTKLVLLAVLCVHWFNPLVWIMYILANRDIELLCDEEVIRLLGENTKADYARTLINMEETQSGFVPLCNSFSKNVIEERIVSIMKYKKSSIFSLVLGFSLVFGTTTAFATSAQKEPDYFITDEDDNTTIFNGKLMASQKFFVDENGKYTYDSNSELDALFSEFGIPSTEFIDSDINDIKFTLEDTSNQNQDHLFSQRSLYTEEEMEQIIADIESGKIPGYQISDFVEGKVPGFEAGDWFFINFD